MTTESNNPDDKTSLVEELTAYLDGELDQESIQNVENRLSEDADYRSEMQTLQKTWDLLDVLPQTEPGTSFTKTTMEMVVGKAVDDFKTKRKRSWVWPVRIVVMLAVPAVLFATSFAVIRNLQTQPDRTLIQDLSVIENHFRYSVVDNDLNFLSRLSQQGLFSDGSSYTEAGSGLLDVLLDSVDIKLTPESIAERQALVESLDVEQKRKLKQKMDDYLKLTDPERLKLKDFDRQLNTHENRIQLTATMNAYYDWLKTIDSGERSRLLDLVGDERIPGIRALRERQALEEFGSTGLASLPSKEDVETVFEWYEFNFGAKERQIRRHFPVAVIEYAKANKTQTPPAEFVRRKSEYGNLPSLVGFILKTDPEFIEDLVLRDREMNVLYHMLTPKAKILLDDRDETQRKQLVLAWIESANQSKCDVSIDRLRKFERSVTDKERDELDKMSSENYVDALRRMFRERQKSSSQQKQSGEDWESFFELNLPSGFSESD